MQSAEGTNGGPLLSVNSLVVHFPVSRTFNPFAKKRFVRAVDGISLDIYREETVALVGESGSGKTTTGRVIARLTPPTSGSITFRGNDVFGMSRDGLKDYRQRVQMIFQDPYESLNPRGTVLDQISLPLSVFGKAKNRSEKEDIASSLLQKVGLNYAEILYKYPHQLSGGERQRVAIARAVATNPEFIVADEPVSMLDVSVRAGVLNLMQELASDFHLSYLFITHDLNVTTYVSDRVAVMYLGLIFELARTSELMSKPYHPYTQLLLESTPRLDREEKTAVRARGEIPSSIDIPRGCRFHPRCPYASEVCQKDIPPLREFRESHFVACHWAERFL